MRVATRSPMRSRSRSSRESTRRSRSRSPPTPRSARCRSSCSARDEQQQQWIPALARGERLAAFGLTEPEAGSDAGATRTTATLRDDSWVVNGSKAFITNAGTEITQCVTITALTGEGEISNLVIENGTPGYEISGPMHKMGWKASDTRALSFTDCAVPEHNLLGARGQGFHQFLEILDGGRISVAAMGVGRRPGRLRPRARLRTRAPAVRSADLVVPGDPVQARRHGDGDRSGARARLEGGLAQGSGTRVRARGGDGKALHRRALESRRQRVAPDPRRLRLHRRVRHLAPLSRSEDPRDRRGDERSTADGDRPAPRACREADGRRGARPGDRAGRLWGRGRARHHLSAFRRGRREDRDRVRCPERASSPRDGRRPRHGTTRNLDRLRRRPRRLDVGHRRVERRRGQAVASRTVRLPLFPVRILRPRACREPTSSGRCRPTTTAPSSAGRPNLSVLPATGSGTEATSLECDHSASASLVVIAGSLVGVRLLRRRPLQER